MGMIACPHFGHVSGNSGHRRSRERMRARTVRIPAIHRLSCKHPGAERTARDVIVAMIELVVGSLRERVSAHLHVCHFASASDEHTATASKFLVDGLRAGHRCIPLIGQAVLNAIRLSCSEDHETGFPLTDEHGKGADGRWRGDNPDRTHTPADPSAMDASPDASQFFTENSLDPYRLIAFQRSVAAEVRRAGGQ